ncbi:hypothetical protein B0H21DRAFT_194021 [Amylocystis lapponica]|nr:hypothetical protein B0H21DRAFT_194021 [Amylocystis lapponica]
MPNYDDLLRQLIPESESAQEDPGERPSSRTPSLDSTVTSETGVHAEDGDVEEYELLGHLSLNDRDPKDHELRTAPIITRAAYVAAGGHANFPQRGVLGSVISVYDQSGGIADVSDNSRLYVNTNAPFSAIVCGVQGSGKSHTVSVLLENMLIANYPKIGSLEKPLSASVELHGPTDLRPLTARCLGLIGHVGLRTDRKVV